MNRKFIEKMMEAKACEREAFAILLTEETSDQAKEFGKECRTLILEHAAKFVKSCMEYTMNDRCDSEKAEHKSEETKCKSVKVE